MNFLKRVFGTGKPAVRPELADRYATDAAAGMTPRKLASIFRAANGGDIENQCRLAREILEHSSSIAQAVQTRVLAVKATGWNILPGDKTPAAEVAANALRKELDSIRETPSVWGFTALLDCMMGALLPGFSVAEILWTPGGHIGGFNPVDQWHFTLRNGYVPALITRDHPMGLELSPLRIIYHRMFRGADPARGGLIRPLGWLYTFGSMSEKNLLSFVERYGMPFVFASTRTETFENEVKNLQRVIKNFGSNLGGVFSEGTNLNLVQAPAATGDVYFKLKKYIDDSVTRLILGQTASSGDGGGLSGDTAQSEVRGDILAADCRAIESAVNGQLIQPWARFNLPPDVAAPLFRFDLSEPEDLLKQAQIISSLAQARYHADPDELSKKFGMSLKYEPAAPVQQGGMFGMSDADPRQSPAKELAGALEQWLGPLAAELADLAGNEDLTDDRFRERLAACAEGKKLGDSKQFEQFLEGQIYEGFAHGATK